MSTKTIVPLDWQRYTARLKANGFNSTWSLARIVDNIFDEMMDQYIAEYGYVIEDDNKDWDRIWEMAERAAHEYKGEWS